MNKALSSPLFQKYKKYCTLYFCAVLISLLLVATVNIIIDPYQYFFTQKIPRVNAIKPEYEKYVMLSKSAEAKHINANTLLLGSSRIMSGLDASHPLFKNPDTVYNLGLPGTNMYQSLQYFKHALYFQKNIERVIIGIDFFMFNEYLDNLDNFDESRLRKKVVISDLIDTSLSIDALQKSLITIQANLKPNSSQNSRKSTVGKFHRWLTNFLDFKGFYKTYNLSEQQINNFRAIINLCKENNINYQVFISPSHATQYEAIDIAGLWLTFEQWKRAIVRITPTWDFSGYNSITTERISESMTNYVDNSHYSKYTGNLVLNKMYNYQSQVVPLDFGFLVDRDNIEHHLDRIKLNRQQWRINNEREVQLVQTVKTKVDRKK